MWVILSVLTGLMLFLTGTVTLSADDYWYSIYLSNGLQEFLRLTVAHYQTMNGRVFIHIVAQIILYFGPYFFALLNLALALWVSRMVTDNWKKAAYIYSLLTAGILLIPMEFHSQSLLWISAYCNYYLPVCLLTAEIAAFANYERRKQIKWYHTVLLFLTAFLSGNSNEQMGLLSVCVALYFLLRGIIRAKKFSFVTAVSVLMAVAGVGSIFLSPATGLRMVYETASSSLLSRLSAHLLDQSNIIMASLSTRFLLLICILVMAVYLQKQASRRFSKIALISLGLLTFLVGLFMPTTTAYLLILTVLLGLSIVLLFSKDGYFAGLSGCCGVGSAIIIMTTTSSAHRTLMPLLLFSILAMAILLVRLLPERGMIGVLFITTILASCVVIPYFPHCWHNAQVERQNNEYAEHAKTSGALYYCADYESDCTYVKASDNWYWNAYMSLVGYDSAEYYIYSERKELPGCYLNGTRLSLPAQSINGSIYLPLRDVVERLGGIVDWEDGNITIYYDNIRYDYKRNEGTIIYEQNGTVFTVPVAPHEHWRWTYLPQTFFTEQLGLTVHLDSVYNRVDLVSP